MANIKGTQQNDVLTGTPGNDRMHGKDGNDTLFGGLGNDHLHGDKGGDYLYGSFGNDDLHGGQNDDNLYGGAGNDKLDGGGGMDTAYYNGNMSEYSITAKHGHDQWTVSDHVANRDGTDQLKNVEFLRFNDGFFDTGHSVVHRADYTLAPNDLAVQQPGDPHPGTMWFGNGNLPTHYNVAQVLDQDVELGLKVHYRTGDDITPTSVDADGTAHYDAPAGAQVVDNAHNVSSAAPNRAAWNFDYEVNTAFDGGSSHLSDYTFKMVVTSNVLPSQTFDFDPATHIWHSENSAASFGGDDNVPAPLSTQVAENSVNVGFYGDPAVLNAAGSHYDITLQMIANNQVIAAVHDIIDIH